MEIIHETILEVDINLLKKNYYVLKNKLNPNTKIIAVIKAYGYGHGDIMLAKKLEKIGAYALWVADFEEGVRLRKSGILTSIIVANPGMKSINEIIINNLDVVIYNLEILKLYAKLNKEICIHIKFNSGMNRYGFDNKDIDLISKILLNNPKLKLKSVCSHLSASENHKKDDFTNKQCDIFEKICEILFKSIGYRVDRHILNTNGVIRFPQNEYEMVRIGIGLYGVSEDDGLRQIGTLKSVVSQIREIKKGDQIGYEASFTASKDMKIGVIPFGYADGLNRKLSNKNGIVIINNFPCPIIGEISMDSCMVNLTNTETKNGDTAIIFSEENTVLSIAKKLDTIPYEILSTLNRRIKRVYSC